MPRDRATRVKDPVQTSSSRTGKRPRIRLMPVAAGGAAVLAVLWAANLTEWGRFATAYIFVVLDFYIGVVTLVSLSVTVMAGLVSTDRILLRIGHRVLFQGIHRAISVIAVVALGIHIAVKVLEAHAAIGDAIVPFYSQGRSRFIGFGTIASYLMLLAFWSGLARIRFIGSARPWLWRVLHCTAYVSWPIALAHGLNAGRAAKTWVTVSYIVCVVGVALALLVRLYTRFGRYALGAKTERAVGVNAQTAIMPRLQDGVSTRAPVTAPRSPVDLPPEPPYYEPKQRNEWAEPAYPEERYPEPAYQEERYPEPAYPEPGYREPAYPDQAYPEPAYSRPDADYVDTARGAREEGYHHDYWSTADEGRDVPLGRWAPPERPRLRLITNDEGPAEPRRSRSRTRAGRHADVEDYRAG